MEKSLLSLLAKVDCGKCTKRVCEDKEVVYPKKHNQEKEGSEDRDSINSDSGLSDSGGSLPPAASDIWQKHRGRKVVDV